MESTDFSVNTWFSRSSTSPSPGNDSVEYPRHVVSESADQWSSRVTGAGILLSVDVSGADLGFINHSGVPIGTFASIKIDDPDGYFLKLVRDRSVLGGVTPAGDHASGTRVETDILTGQTNWFDIVIISHSIFSLDHSNIV